MEKASDPINRHKYRLAQDVIGRGTWIPDVEAGTLYSTKFARYVESRTYQGYCRGSVWDPEAKRQYVVLVHRVLWEFANGPLPDALVINHINGLKHDNRACNIEAVTHQANINHAHDTGLWPGIVRNGELRPLVEARLKAGVGHADVAREFGIGTGTVSRIHQMVPDWAGPHRVDPTATSKGCSRCGIAKPLAEFGVARSKPDGRTAACRLCSRIAGRLSDAKRRRNATRT